MRVRISSGSVSMRGTGKRLIGGVATAVVIWWLPDRIKGATSMGCDCRRVQSQTDNRSHRDAPYILLWGMYFVEAERQRFGAAAAIHITSMYLLAICFSNTGLLFGIYF